MDDGHHQIYIHVYTNVYTSKNVVVKHLYIVFYNKYRSKSTVTISLIQQIQVVLLLIAM